MNMKAEITFSKIGDSIVRISHGEKVWDVAIYGAKSPLIYAVKLLGTSDPVIFLSRERAQTFFLDQICANLQLTDFWNGQLSLFREEQTTNKND